MTIVPGLLLTTCHLQNDGIEDLIRLVASVEAALLGNEVVSLRHIILLQGCRSTRRREIQRQLPPWVELLFTDRSLSSPAARNVLISHLLADSRFDSRAFVGFPDDDAWYPTGALACVARHFGSAIDLQLLLSRYGPCPSAADCNGGCRASLQQALSHGACAAIFVRAGLLAQLGGFSELLGLGTELSGGEDTEFVHRAFQHANKQILCVPGTLVGHAAADPLKKAKYYEGALAAIMAHSHTSTAARMALLRKLLAGVWLVIRHRMSVSQYLRSLRRARATASFVRVGVSATPERTRHNVHKKS